MNKKADDSKEEYRKNIREYVEFIFNGIREQDEGYPEEHHEEMVQKAVNALLSGSIPEKQQIPDIDVSGLLEFDKSVEEFNKNIIELESKLPGSSEVIFGDDPISAIKNMGKRYRAKKDMPKSDLTSGFEGDQVNIPEEEIEVEFHPDAPHRHEYEDKRVFHGYQDLDPTEMMNKKQNLDHNNIRKTSVLKKESFFNSACSPGAALKVALVLKLATCLSKKMEKELKESIDELHSEFFEIKSIRSKGQKSDIALDLEESYYPGVAEKALGLIGGLGLPSKNVTLYVILPIYSLYRLNTSDIFYPLQSYIAEMGPMEGLKAGIWAILFEFGLGFATAYFAPVGAAMLANAAKNLIKIRKYYKIMEKNCILINKSLSLIRKSQIITKLRSMKGYKSCLEDVSDDMEISVPYAKKILAKKFYKKSDLENNNIIKTSLDNLMNFFEENNFSEKNDLKLLISKVK